MSDDCGTVDQRLSDARSKRDQKEADRDQRAEENKRSNNNKIKMYDPVLTNLNQELNDLKFEIRTLKAEQIRCSGRQNVPAERISSD